ncbi:MAG TPA: hypothetical protein VF174_11980 [Micromonosporaceae bacterium]
MKRRAALLLAPLLAGGVLIGCTEASPHEPAQRTGGPDEAVVHLHGVADIGFGDTLAELTRRGVLTLRPEACGPRLTALPTVSPVFAKDRLVLLWVEPPARTPEGITVGTPVAEVRTAYPDVRELTAPPGTYRFNGLLVVEGDRAYLFLHDGSTVRKAVVGYAEYARRLFDDGFGTC